MTIDIKLGSYSFGNNIDTYEVEHESRVEQVPIPRRDGVLSDTAYKSGMRIRLGGLILEVDDATARATLNSLKNAFSSGKTVLTIYNDRQITVQKTMFSWRYEEGDMRRIRWEAEVVADDFGFVAVDPTASEKTITATPQTESFTNNGNLETPLVIRITAGSNDIASGLRIDNLTTGKYCIYNAVIAAGTYIEIDTDLVTVVDGSAVNKISNFSGDFFKLAAGANSVRWTGTATGSPKLKLTYRDKYDGS